jgi:hypothetical protein
MCSFDPPQQALAMPRCVGIPQIAVRPLLTRRRSSRDLGTLFPRFANKVRSVAADFGAATFHFTPA